MSSRNYVLVLTGEGNTPLDLSQEDVDAIIGLGIDQTSSEGTSSGKSKLFAELSAEDGEPLTYLGKPLPVEEASRFFSLGLAAIIRLALSARESALGE